MPITAMWQWGIVLCWLPRRIANHFGLYRGGLRPGSSRVVYNRLEALTAGPASGGLMAMGD